MVHHRRRPLVSVLVSAVPLVLALVVPLVVPLLVPLLVPAVGPAMPAAAAATGTTATTAAAQYSATLTQAIADLPTAAESRSGYSRDLFRHWVDADGDGCDTRDEVLIAEAEEAPSIGSGCALSGGRWYSYYDGVSQTSASALDIDHLVPLAEAWDSGAGSWTSATRQAYANDLADYRTLVGVTAALNRSKGDQDIAEWRPPKQQCRYLREWVAVKHRWRLSVDGTEKSSMRSLATGCTDSTITVTLAR